MKKIIIANWKANKNISQAKNWFDQLVSNLNTALLNKQVVIAPPANLIGQVADILNRKYPNLSFVLAVQNISHFLMGSYTGQLSIDNFQNQNVYFGLVGHSEVRKYLGDTNHLVYQKSVLLLERSITPILCVNYQNYRDQLAYFDNLETKKIMVALEPEKSIGTGVGESLQNVLKWKKIINESYSVKAVLYGGSVDVHNAKEYLLIVDGILVGNMSLDPYLFAKILMS